MLHVLKHQLQPTHRYVTCREGPYKTRIAPSKAAPAKDACDDYGADAD